MPASKTKEEAYKECLSNNLIIQKEEIDIDKIRSMVQIVDEYLESGKDDLIKKRFNSAYCSYYDVLRELVEAFLLFDKVKSLNHQCLFAYLCINHLELELDWNFFEKIRTKRNGINYYGDPVNEKDWKEVELQFNLYIDLLKKEIKKKLNRGV